MTMNRVLNFAVASASALIMANTRVDAAVINITAGSTSGYTMTDGNTYVVQNSVSFSNSTAGGSGMSVADNATVVLYVPAGITLTATGANGSGQTGGGAGIRVPETATLVITGEGTVNATGGNAGNGGNGANGSIGSAISATVQTETGKGKGSSGVGGAGGLGGGGAGAAIGGNGSLGGSGGNGGAARVLSSYVSIGNFCGNGNVGSSGSAGSNGIGMGACYVLGEVSIVATGGGSGTAGNAGGFADWTFLDHYYSSTHRYYATCGGGGGGGGGAGKTPSCSIGGGGSSGGGGGGGGSGATAAENDYAYKYWPMTNAHGGGGAGGMSSITSGETGTGKTKTKGGYSSGGSTGLKDCSGGDGGAGGAAGAEGGAGTLYVAPTATVNVEREKLEATTHPAAQYTLTFDTNGGQFTAPVETLMVTLGCELPDSIPSPVLEGYTFGGWMTITGDEYYGASGVKSVSSYPVACDTKLYAKWRLDDNYTTTTPEPTPYSYLKMNCPTLLAEYGGDYEAAALATAANGRNAVWECYVAGINPTNETEKFTARIELEDGVPIVTWGPNLNTNGIIHAYKVYGSETIENGGEWQYPTNSLHRFFKVTVEMP